MQERQRDSSAINELNRGGQVLMHFLRMLHQTISRYFKAVTFVFISASLFFTYKMTDATDWYMGLKYGYSYTFVNYIGLKDGKANLTLPDGRTVAVTDRQIVQSAIMQQHAKTLQKNLVKGAALSFLIAMVFAWALFKYLRKKGREQRSEEHIRGMKFVSKTELIDAVKERINQSDEASNISVAGVPLLPHQEKSGIVLIGSPGVGKSNTIRDVLRQMREQKRKCVLYDISGEFVKNFYRPEKDIILSVFDKRSASWDFWAEGKNPAMYDRMAKAAIPDNPTGGDPFWTVAPQLLFSALLEELGKRFDKPDVEHLMNIILKMPDDKIVQVVSTTDARNIMNLELDKLAGSVRAVITAYTRNFKYLSLMNGPRFSFKSWAQNEDDDQWVFITVRDDMKATMKPLITMMLEAALSAILTLEPERSRSIGTSFDELATLHEIPSLIDYISTCRKFGGVPILGFQSNSQVDVVYGDKKADVLMDSMGVLAAFRINGAKGATWLAEQLGDREAEKAAENTSFGANDVRDATSINRNAIEGNVLLKSQILELDDNEFYLSLKRGLPVARIKNPYLKLATVAPAFVENDFFKDETKVASFRSENSITPESIVAEINKTVRPKEQSRHLNKENDTSTRGKTFNDIVSDVVKGGENKPGALVSKDNTPRDGDDIETTSDENNSSDEGGAFVDEFSTVDLGALSMERESDISDQKEVVDKKQPTLDIFDGFKLP
ncbi:type IV secretion system DNA-binding domain-containing protein [Cronobacter sakazakii]|nr:type IV secretion system DNA-binding domain-containing protein [Cronobacter sakazakii]EJV9557800.1 type IV secretion system DNA-binding domain-containing protein [Cronobacter sakazakii]EJV9561854.1 type IV secretion system DNA-binding domain-containing protein [Cronobacter sakazakii]EJX1223048.1 type IV secretion system DNA-binding domain-containing protein [Cronobacter sakazakii]EJX4594371.1 type IV secretion system DNA-binding domain-containing protein [Cronobacter sakazakii]